MSKEETRTNSPSTYFEDDDVTVYGEVDLPSKNYCLFNEISSFIKQFPDDVSSIDFDTDIADDEYMRRIIDKERKRYQNKSALLKNLSRINCLSLVRYHRYEINKLEENWIRERNEHLNNVRQTCSQYNEIVNILLQTGRNKEAYEIQHKMNQLINDKEPLNEINRRYETLYKKVIERHQSQYVCIHRKLRATLKRVKCSSATAISNAKFRSYLRQSKDHFAYQDTNPIQYGSEVNASGINENYADTNEHNDDMGCNEMNGTNANDQTAQDDGSQPNDLLSIVPDQPQEKGSDASKQIIELTNSIELY